MDFNLNIKILVFGVLCGALSYWLTGYNETSVFGIHIYIIAAATVSISGYVLASKFKYETKPIIQNLVFGFLIALVGRIIFDTLTVSSTSHNLAPLEILIIFLIVSIASTIGSKIGELN